MSADSENILKRLFEPDSIAVIGASQDPTKLGGRPVHYMKTTGYTGRMYPVNRKGGEIQGLKAYKDIREVPEAVDMAVVSVPAPFVVDAIEGCVERGVATAVIISSGFAEVGGEGEAWQERLVEIAKSSGIRLVGPNCMGMLNTRNRAIGTFSSAFEHGWPKVGEISIISQSGAVGGHMLVLARERGLGIQGWMTTGNECDVDVAECLAFCAESPDTRVIIAYMEGCKSPGKLKYALDLARLKGKPVIMMKVGASDVGTVAANTHTASLTGADAVYEAIFRQYGVHRASSLEEMMDVAAACATGRFPATRRLGIVTISGGVGVLSADTAAACGLEVPALPEAAQQKLKALMPFAAVRNPVDTTAQMLTDTDLLRSNMEVMQDEGDCDAIIIFMSTIGLNERMMGLLEPLFAEVIKRDPDKLTVLAMLCRPDGQARLEEMGYLVIPDPSRAIQTIAAMARFAESFARAESLVPPALPGDSLAAPDRIVGEHEASAILASAGLAMAPGRITSSADDAVAAAEEFGHPVVLKIASAEIQHKSDIGGVKLNLQSAEAVRQAYSEIIDAAGDAAPGATLDGVLVTPMISGGVETIIGVNRDPVFGPVVLFGLGGIFVEVLKDVSFRVAPFGIDEARRMIDEVKGRAMLDGVRGAAPVDVEALAETLAQLSVFAAANADRIESIDINPFLVQEKGGIGVDAVIVPTGTSTDG